VCSCLNVVQTYVIDDLLYLIGQDYAENLLSLSKMLLFIWHLQLIYHFNR
jgi:hypothetical protein